MSKMAVVCLFLKIICEEILRDASGQVQIGLKEVLPWKSDQLLGSNGHGLKSAGV